MAYFKYIPYERFANYREGKIRFTQPGAFNDPFEMPAFKARDAEAARLAGLAGLSTQTGEIQAGLTQGRIPEAAFTLPIFYFMGMMPQQRQEKAIPSADAVEKLRTIDQKFGILSLSMTADNLLLWAHYANEHRGLAVEIDPGNREFNSRASDDNFQLAERVKYSAMRPKIPETEEILFEHFFVKSREWSYEQEYRIVRNLKSSIEKKEGEPPIHLYALPPAAIRKVIFGYRVTTDQARALIAATKADPAFGHVAYAKAVLDPGQFKILIRDYEETPERPNVEVVDLQGNVARP
ncbi:DUF2971 domain-containing protein [Bradyrhizobium lablabi]|uniref:DUF2971 domain-containing protein n=1 Tax=Bradyrhizobium lablabi TaxID=722472 RepID=UPI001BAB655F|nr:DUF2971 domain-containing protein [Bradyrhizobium lablabi]MBR1122994.1 DUF2971 domain-containing protein [Bradyrhizobium lablabi]